MTIRVIPKLYNNSRNLNEPNLILMILVQAAKLIGGGLAAIGLAGAGVGIGTIFGGLLNAYSRNPEEQDQLFQYAILGFALTEAIALFALMVTFLILYGF